jgi:hypothetical protein
MSSARDSPSARERTKSSTIIAHTTHGQLQAGRTQRTSRTSFRCPKRAETLWRRERTWRLTVSAAQLGSMTGGPTPDSRPDGYLAAILTPRNYSAAGVPTVVVRPFFFIHASHFTRYKLGPRFVAFAGLDTRHSIIAHQEGSAENRCGQIQPPSTCLSLPLAPSPNIAKRRSCPRLDDPTRDSDEVGFYYVWLRDIRRIEDSIDRASDQRSRPSRALSTERVPCVRRDHACHRG